MTVTPRANMLKSRSLAMSKGLRKLSPGTRSSITGSIAVPQLKLKKMYPAMMTKIGYDSSACTVSVTRSEMRPAGQMATVAKKRLIVTMIAKQGRLTPKTWTLCGSPRK